MEFRIRLFSFKNVWSILNVSTLENEDCRAPVQIRERSYICGLSWFMYSLRLEEGISSFLERWNEPTTFFLFSNGSYIGDRREIKEKKNRNVIWRACFHLFHGSEDQMNLKWKWGKSSKVSTNSETNMRHFTWKTSRQSVHWLNSWVIQPENDSKTWKCIRFLLRWLSL